MAGRRSGCGLRGPVPISGADGRFDMFVTPGTILVFANLHDQVMDNVKIDVASGATVDVGTLVVRPSKK